MGHDVPTPLYTPDLAHTGRQKISLLFGGIGDARNLHCTLLGIFDDESKYDGDQSTLPGRGSGKSFHFTIVDIKPAAIARDLLIFLLLHDFNSIAVRGQEVRIRSKLLPCLYYTYLAPVMPRQISDILQRRIKTMIKMLEDRKPLPPFLDVPKLYRPAILRVLRQWQAEASEEYPTARVRRAAIVTRKEQKLHEQMRAMHSGHAPPQDATPQECVKEKQFYEATGLLPLRRNTYEVYSPELHNCIEGHCDSAAKYVVDSTSRAIKICDETWATNVTMVDLDWQRNKSAQGYDIDVSNDIYKFAAQLGYLGLQPEDACGLYDYFEQWFMAVSVNMRFLAGRYRIEACVGDVTAVLEAVRYGVVGHRAKEPSGGISQGVSLDSVNSVATTNGTAAELDDYPRLYDRIHLSNIPDYIGGTLSSFLYATPVTYPGKASYVTSTNLRNPPRFPTIASFDNEYLGLCDPSDIAKVFRVRMKPLEDPNEIMPSSRYNEWHHVEVRKDLSSLMPRARLENWLERLFLKIAIPIHKDDIESNTLIYSPLNLTVFFRILLHLHHAGYPAHWLSGVWSEILSGKLTTSARAPRSEPLSLKESRKAFPVLEQSTAPFVAELTTFTALWQPALPFAIPVSNLPLIHQVHQYSVRFRKVSDRAGTIPQFILAFYDKSIKEYGFDLRKHLLDDELGLPRKSSAARRINESRLHIVTTWKYDRSSRTATFWFRSDLMEELASTPSDDQLRLAIWRTDNYKRQSSSRRVAHIHDHGTWVRNEYNPISTSTAALDEGGNSSDWSDIDSEEEAKLEHMFRMAARPRAG